MGILDSIERGLERTVNGAFARTFRSGVQPVEISAALKRELDIKAVAVDRDRILAPNIFTVTVAAKDAEKLRQIGSQLQTELEQVVMKHAATQNYQLLGPAVINFTTADFTSGTLEVTSQNPNGAVSWSAALEVEGQVHPIRVGTTIVGRGADSDIRIADSAASRRHLEVLWDGKKGLVRDLGATNGSKIDGQRFREAQLQQDMVIYIGQTPLRFRFVPLQQGSGQQGSTSNFWEGA